MAVVNPLPKEQAAQETHGVYDALTGKFGRMPNIFALMAHHPAALTSFMPFFQSGGRDNVVRDREGLRERIRTFRRSMRQVAL